MSDYLVDIQNEETSLKGNINRMCVTDDINELRDMYKWALDRIANIYTINNIRIRQKGDKNEKINI